MGEELWMLGSGSLVGGSVGTGDAGTKLVESIEVGSLVEGVSELPVLMSVCDSAGVIGKTAKAGKLVESIAIWLTV